MASIRFRDRFMLLVTGNNRSAMVAPPCEGSTQDGAFFHVCSLASFSLRTRLVVEEDRTQGRDWGVRDPVNPTDRDAPHRPLRVKGEGAGEMIKVIEELLRISGRDGDFIKVGIPTMPDLTGIDQVLEAWSEERGRGIECVLLLDRVHRLLSGILAAGRLTDQGEREAKSLLRVTESHRE